ncbi:MULTISPECIES: hypothetical protein [unclassified Robiginitalea]|uniref:hypothetical protein n=1 Tax=Robiginitalea TaxID=252306 RepID=UPI00234ACC97|nr:MULTISPECIES: hypothetical protein [unclassified Robiginitalea]MDC6354124.1 hypothetical protein [Robiginitalea sp. PM2]MDC6374391.1 hypothetical protein [Robiginitalea sp. SP8]
MKRKVAPQKIARKRFFLESLALLLIICSPFLFKLHEYFPKREGEVFEFFGIVFDSNGFADVSTYVWFLVGKIIPIYLLIIWFFTCKHWWYHILLIPICMYAFQIFEVIYSSDDVVDTENVLWLLPICMIVIPFVYFIRLKLFDKYVHGIDLEAMNAELQYYKDKEQEQLQKVGINVEEKTQSENIGSQVNDLSDKTPRRTLNKMLSSLQHSLKSLF